jgi:hypothetical protein
MSRWVGTFLSNFFSSIFISAVLFVVILTAISGKFPPDFKMIGRSLEALKGLSQAAAVSTPKTHTDDGMIDSLLNLQQNRQMFGETIFGGGKKELKPLARPPEEIDIDARILENERRISSLQSRVESLAAEIEELKARSSVEAGK